MKFKKREIHKDEEGLIWACVCVLKKFEKELVYSA